MKKKQLLLAALFLFASLTQAQDLNKVFKKYAPDDQFEYISVGSTLMKFASFFADSENGKLFSKMKHIKMLKITQDDKNQATFESFQNDLNKILDDKDFESIAVTKTKTDSTNIISRTLKENNTDIIIISHSNKTVSIIWIKGKITKEEWEQLVDEGINL